MIYLSAAFLAGAFFTAAFLAGAFFAAGFLAVSLSAVVVFLAAAFFLGFMTGLTFLFFLREFP